MGRSFRLHTWRHPLLELSRQLSHPSRRKTFRVYRNICTNSPQLVSAPGTTSKMRYAISIFLILRTGVVGRNIHMRQICYDQLDETMRKVPTALSPVIAVDRKASRPLHKQIYD